MLLKMDFEFMPLNQFPELNTFKKKYEGRSFLWSWVLVHGDNSTLGIAVEVDMYRLAAALFFEDRQIESKTKRRIDFRTQIRKFVEYELKEVNDLNSVLLCAIIN